MRVRVQGATVAAGFDPAKMKADRPIVLDDQDLPRRGSGFFWPRRAMMLSRIPGLGPRCALGAVDRRRRQLGQAGSAAGLSDVRCARGLGRELLGRNGQET